MYQWAKGVRTITAHMLTITALFTASGAQTSTAYKRSPPFLRRVASKRSLPTICGDQQIRYCRICARVSYPQSRLSDEKRSEHLMRKSRFSKTPSGTAEPFFFFLFPSGFSCFFFCERRNKRNETKKYHRK